MPVAEEDMNLVPADMSSEAVMQAWYRILHTIGNPVDLCRPHLISQTPEFLQYSISAEEGAREPSQHACLAALPHIFLRAMRGLAAHVDAFLGRGTERWLVAAEGGGAGGGGGGAGGAGGERGEGDDLTPPAHRRLAKSFSAARPRDKPAERSTPRTSLIGLTSSRPSSVVPTTPPNSISSQVGESEKPPLTPLRPKVNSILHLFGEWLFEAALIGTTPVQNVPQRADGTPPPPSLSDATHKLNMLSYQAGRAVALGTLCRVLCSKQCREAVLAPYLARAYAALQRGLRDPATAAAVVLDSADIFRLDLDGVLVLVPDYITALDRILSEREPKLECGSIDKRELRKAAISILLSLVAFPYHYKGLAVPEFPGCNEYAGVTLGEFARGRLALLCVCAVQAEGSEALAAPLLAALYLAVRHYAAGGNARNASTLSHSTHYKARSDGGSGPASAEGLSQDDFAADVRELDPNSPVFGAALVVRATYLVCHRLISSWKGDLHVSLAALELLSGLAKLHSAKPEAVERKRAVRWICDYISVQCGRPPQAHSRDLHSCVVAAYACLAAWLCAPLLADPDCLAALMEVVELGIAGTKSHGKPGEPPKMKDEKELKPVSMRVRDAAESLLMLILEQAGTGAGSWCRLDERWLGALGHGRLRHYAADGNTLLSLLEEPLANSQEPQPTVVVIIRNAWGRYAWSLSSRGAARSARRGGAACARPVPIAEPPPRAPPACRALPAHPAAGDRAPALDAAFPSLDAVLRQLNDPEAPTLFRLLEQQAVIEKRVRESEDNVVPDEYVPPEPVTEFQTARLFLSHFGYLNIGGEKKGASPRLVALDGCAAGLSRALRRLDATGARAALTAHVFCARAGQRAARDIVANARDPAAVPPAFVRMLRGLGTPVRVRGHGGWTGHVRTSYDAEPPAAPAEPAAAPPAPPEKLAPAIYDGREQVLYWADSTDEIAFVVPSGYEIEEQDEQQQNDSLKSDVDGSCLSVNRGSGEKSGGSGGSGSCWDVSGAPSYERSISESERGDRAERPRAPLGDKARALSLELDKNTPPAALSGSGRRNRDFTTKILIVWLEDFEDHLNLPIDDLLRYCECGVPWRRAETRVVCVSAVRSGLLRVRAPPDAAPLADGALLAPRLLPAALRRAARHLARRARLHTDLYQPPHVRRRHLIQDIAQQFKKDLTEPELLESLFRAP
ncbi:ral GTPase-activating protein subunit beta isoform X2 [Epargyreus clarus]